MTRRSPRRVFTAARVYLVLATLACSLDHIKVAESGSATLQGSPELAALPASTFSGTFSSLTNIDITSNATFKSKNADINDIKSAKIYSLTLQITAPSSGQDFTFIDDVKFYASTPEIQKTLIAQGGPFTAGLTEVGLDVGDVDLKPFLASKAFSITNDVTGRSPTQATTIKASVVLDVEVNVKHLVCGN